MSARGHHGTSSRLFFQPLPAIAGQHIQETTKLHVSTTDLPVQGGGTANTAFLRGAAQGPNAVSVSATFWLETIEGNPAIQQLQYAQTVLLNFIPVPDAPDNAGHTGRLAVPYGHGHGRVLHLRRGPTARPVLAPLRPAPGPGRRHPHRTTGTSWPGSGFSGLRHRSPTSARLTSPGTTAGGRPSARGCHSPIMA